MTARTLSNTLKAKMKTVQVQAKTLSGLLVSQMNDINSRIQVLEPLKTSKNLDEKEYAYFMEEVYNEILEKIKLRISQANVNRKIKFLTE
jgi:hypothetical protein